MSMSDPIADMLTRVRNAGKARKSDVRVKFSSVKQSIAQILVREGYLQSVEVAENENKTKDLVIKMRYAGKSPVFKEITRVSKPGLRVYLDHSEIVPVNNNLGIGIMSTSKGVITSVEAKRLGIGGEYLCRVF